MIEMNNPMPLYFQIKEMLKEKIERGKYEPGECIPSENQLAEELDISKPTIRRAVDELAREGYVKRIRGKGTYVTGTKIDQGFIGNLEGYSEDMKRRGLKLTSQILEQEILEPDEKVQNKLELSKEQQVVKLTRLRYIEGEPILITTSYLPAFRVPNLLSHDFRSVSLYSVLEGKYGYNISTGIRSLEACLANAEEAHLLEMCEGDPIQYIESIVYLDDGSPIEYIEAKVKGTRSRFSVELVRNRSILRNTVEAKKE